MSSRIFAVPKNAYSADAFQSRDYACIDAADSSMPDGKTSDGKTKLVGEIQVFSAKKPKCRLDRPRVLFALTDAGRCPNVNGWHQNLLAYSIAAALSLGTEKM